MRISILQMVQIMLRMQIAIHVTRVQRMVPCLWNLGQQMKAIRAIARNAMRDPLAMDQQTVSGVTQQETSQIIDTTPMDRKELLKDRIAVHATYQQIFLMNLFMHLGSHTNLI